MTDTQKLIAELRAWAGSNQNQHGRGGVVDQAAAALEAQEAKIAEAMVLHQPMKIWESDRSYTLACRECALKLHPCPTVRILSADAPTEPVTGERLTEGTDT